jgi:hypothetical protein
MSHDTLITKIKTNIQKHRVEGSPEERAISELHPTKGNPTLTTK